MYSVRRGEPFFLYRVSYVYYPLIGVVVCIIVGLAVSWYTGANKPHKMDPDLLSPVIHKYISFLDEDVVNAKLMKNHKVNCTWVKLNWIVFYRDLYFRTAWISRQSDEEPTIRFFWLKDDGPNDISRRSTHVPVNLIVLFIVIIIIEKCNRSYFNSRQTETSDLFGNKSLLGYWKPYLSFYTLQSGKQIWNRQPFFIFQSNRN